MKPKITKTETKVYLTNELAKIIVQKFSNPVFNGTKDDIRLSYYASMNYISVKRKTHGNVIFLNFKIGSNLSLEQGEISRYNEVELGRETLKSEKGTLLYSYSPDSEYSDLDAIIKETENIINQYIDQAQNV